MKQKNDIKNITKKMNVIDYLHDEKKLQRNLLKFIESDEDCDKYYQKFIKYFEKLKIEESHSDLQRILNSIIHITNNHRRYSNFYGKIKTNNFIF